MKHMELDDVRKLAALCRIELTNEEAGKLRGDMESILGYVSEIGGVVAEIATPTASAHRNIMRDDGEPHISGMYTEDILKAAPVSEDGYVKVKAIL